jgi:S-methylmethionine-dependent homocysteine/selenocysteine methylase
MTSDPMAGRGPLLLGGGVATELQRAGMPVHDPWWTSRALLTDAHRQTLRSVHEAALGAGARVVTANTFRANLRTLSRTRLDDAGKAWIVHAAVGVAAAARNEAGRPEALVAGSIGPVEDCYRPELVPADDELRAEHGWLVRELSRAGVDLYLIETMNTVREAEIALERVRAADGHAWVSFVCGADATLLSGEKLADAARAVADAEVVLVNCTSPGNTETALAALREVRDGPIGAYPGIEDRTGLPAYEHVDRALPAALDPAGFAALLASWRDRYGLSVLGGCCGTSPAHLAAVGERVAAAAV